MSDAVQRLLVVTDEEGDPTRFVQRYLAVGYEVATARGVGAACAELREQEFSVMLADMAAADDATLAVVRAARRTRPAPAVVLILPRHAPDAPLVLALMREVAYVCLRHPVDLPELDALVAAACVQVGRERMAARSAPVLRGARDLVRWHRAQEALERALVAVAALGPIATRERLGEAADEVGRLMRADRNPSLDAAAVEFMAGVLEQWAERTLRDGRAA